jgi:capsular polysaccharide biosynthesis protein
MPANHSEPVQSQTDIPEDEIELIDLLRVIWKWKYLIIGGTVVFALAAMFNSFNMQPIYQVSMVLKSGLNTVGTKKNSVYLDSVENFRNIIEKELLPKVLEQSKNRKNRGVATPKAFKIRADNYKNILKIHYNSTDREQGVENLNLLLKLLIEKYEKKLKYFQDNYEYELMAAKRQLEFSIDEERFIASRLGVIQKGIDRYTQEIEQLNDSYDSHSQYQKMLQSYSAIIQNIVNLKRKHAQAELQIDLYKKKIADLEKEMLSKQAIIVTLPPTASQHPVKPNKMRNLILAAMLGLIVMVFLSFFLEYITKYRKKRL